MIKFLVWGFWSLVCALLALIPEGAMWTIWHVVGPTQEATRIILACVFVLAGGGISIAFGFGGFALWCAGTKAIVDTRF